MGHSQTHLSHRRSEHTHTQAGWLHAIIWEQSKVAVPPAHSPNSWTRASPLPVPLLATGHPNLKISDFLLQARLSHLAVTQPTGHSARVYLTHKKPPPLPLEWPLPTQPLCPSFLPRLGRTSAGSSPRKLCQLPHPRELAALCIRPHLAPLPLPETSRSVTLRQNIEPRVQVLQLLSLLG